MEPLIRLDVQKTGTGICESTGKAWQKVLRLIYIPSLRRSNVGFNFKSDDLESNGLTLQYNREAP
jgi:hypothetical protein